MKRPLERKIGLAPAKTAYLEREFRGHFADSWVTGFEHLIGKMTNDKTDRHVLAAAVHARASDIVTFNKRHFPPAATSQWNVEAVGPAAFLEALCRQAPFDQATIWGVATRISCSVPRRLIAKNCISRQPASDASS